MKPLRLRMSGINITYGHYLKVIYELALDGSPVSTSTIARRLKVSNASVSDMLRKLDNDKFVHHVPYKGVELTEKGRQEALRLIRRHRLWELFLVEYMKMPWELVHPQADRLEHATDDVLEERLAELLKHPLLDPHGAPIPAKDGSIDEPPRVRLSDMKKGKTAVILYCTDENPDLLKHLKKNNLLPGISFTVADIQAFDGVYILKIGRNEVQISSTLAKLVIVNPES